jgi:hypothetical protein
MCVILSTYFDAKFAWSITFLPLCPSRERYCFWKLSAFVCRNEISEILHCFMLTLNVAAVLLLDVSVINAIGWGSDVFHGKSALIQHVFN